MKKERNYLVELWRFMFCIAVLGLHFFTKIESEWFHAGYLGVEFFFLVSGYFIGSYYTKKLESKKITERLKEVINYIFSRLKRLYPFYVIALIFMLIINTFINHLGFRGMLKLLKSCLAEFFLIQWTPLGGEVLISADWYVPAVFWGGLVFVILLAFTGKIGGLLIAPITSFFIYRYYFLLIGKIDIIVYHHCILRGIAGIGLGVFIYFLCLSLEKIKFPQWLSTLSLSFSNVALLCVFIYTLHGHRSRWDFFVIAVYAISIFIMMKADIPKFSKNIEKCFSLLGKVTYPVYIFQMPVIEVILHLIR